MRPLFTTTFQTFEKGSILFKVKEGENFNLPPNFGGLTTGIQYKVFRGFIRLRRMKI
jgi:hypothetical protein